MKISKHNACLSLLMVLFFSGGFAHAQEPSGTIVYSQLTGDFWQIWRMDLKTKKVRQLTDSASDKRAPQCSADGTQLLYRSANAELFLLNLQDSKEPPRQIFSDLGIIMDESWSSDGKHVLLTRMRSDLQDDSDVWLADVAGANIREITKETLLQYHPEFLDEQNIVFVSQDAQSGGHNLWRKGIQEDGKGTQLTTGHFYDLLPSVTFDHQAVVFSSNRSGSFDIWQFNLATKELRRLTEGPGLETSPSFSPDNQSILFVSTGSGSKQIWLMKSDGSGALQVTDNQTPRQEPSWCHSSSLKEQKP